MTIAQLFQQAVANRAQTGERYGVARVTLSDGCVIVCHVAPVAGRSIVTKHDRQGYGIIPAGAQYAKPISRATATKLLRNASVQ